jgi:hypothetical protein
MSVEIQPCILWLGYDHSPDRQLLHLPTRLASRVRSRWLTRIDPFHSLEPVSPDNSPNDKACGIPRLYSCPKSIIRGGVGVAMGLSMGILSTFFEDPRASLHISIRMACRWV